MTVAKWARRLNFVARRRFPRAIDLPPLILVSDPKRLPDPLRAAARLPRGSAVLLRAYDARDQSALAQRLAKLCRRQGLRLLIAGDDRLASKVRADGTHFSEAAARLRPSAKTRHTGLVTVACHGVASLRRAKMYGADACFLSPVFETASHPGARTLDVWRFARLVRQVELPVYALGGINDKTVRRLAGSGACGVAAISALAAAEG